MEPQAHREGGESNSKGHEGDLEDLIGIDTNILVYALDPTFSEHTQAKRAMLSSDGCAVNPTVIHETYHTLVHRRRISPADSKQKIIALLKDRRVVFVNLTKTMSLLALELAARMNLGGRDSLVIACFLHNRLPQMYTHDEALLRLGQVSTKGKTIRIADPIA